ncbi:MAG TPA: hypothetical protein VFZ21_11285 [Gemmatimonadaceae bacterium]|nr:hypothetical protein [Gemmatimonadaceae bacterium]
MIIAPEANSDDYRAQRAVLLEVLAAPVTIRALAGRLRTTPRHVRVATDALAAAGLVEIDGEVVSPTAAAVYMDALWPIVV